MNFMVNHPDVSFFRNLLITTFLLLSKYDHLRSQRDLKEERDNEKHLRMFTFSFHFFPSIYFNLLFNLFHSVVFKIFYLMYFYY